MQRPLALLSTFAKGFLMGSADVVPGVSGGTVALVTGIYPTLVGAISTGSKAVGELLRGSFGEAVATLRRVDWWFLVPLVVGAGAAVITLAGLIETLIVDQPIRTAAAFLGMIAATIVVAWRLLREPTRTHLVIAGVVGTVSCLLFGLQSSAASDPALWTFAAAGAIAIAAFILPGVSGSFVLLALGMYQAVLSAVTDRDLAIVAVFAAGAIISLALFSRVLDRLLRQHHDLVTAGLIGLMIGSVRILWPWPNGLGDADGVVATVLGAPGDDVIAPIAIAIVAAAAVLVINSLATPSARRHSSPVG